MAPTRNVNTVLETTASDKCNDVSSGSTAQISSSSTEIDNYLTQLKYKRTFQDEEVVGPAASVLPTPEVSKVMSDLFGVGKKDLTSDTKDTLKYTESFFKDLINATKASSGEPQAKEAMSELFHNPEHLIFQKVLCNEPGDWGKLVLPVVHDVIRKEALKEQIKKDIKDTQLKRRELAKDIGLAKKDLEALKTSHERKLKIIKPDNYRRLQIALESCKAEADKLEASRVEQGSVPAEEVVKLITNFKELKIRHEQIDAELLQISAQNALPPTVNGAANFLAERQTYLEALREQLTDPSLDFSANSLDNSMFSSSK